MNFEACKGRDAERVRVLKRAHVLIGDRCCVVKRRTYVRR